MKIIRLSQHELIDALFFLLGLSSTITLLRIPTPLKVITVHNLFMYLTVFVLLLVHFKKFIITNSIFNYYIVIVILSMIMVLIFPVGPDWTKTSLINTINYLFFYFVIYSYIRRGKGTAKTAYFRGLKVSALLQLIWEGLQATFWYVFHRKLNYELFSSVSVLNDIKLSQHDIYGNYRFTGLGWQSSNLAMALLLGYVLFRNKYIRLAFILGIIASTSRVGIVCIVIIVCFEIFYLKKKPQLIENIFDIIIMIGIVCVGIYLAFSNSKLFFGVISSFSDVSKRFGDISWDLHFLYYIWIPEVISKMPIYRILFGYGMGCSGYAYSHFKGVYIENGPWIPENDFCSTLFGTGILGLIFLYTWYLRSMCMRNRRSMDFTILLMIFFAGFMYAYISSWVLIVVMFCMSGEYLDHLGSNHLSEVQRMKRIHSMILSNNEMTVFTNNADN